MAGARFKTESHLSTISYTYDHDANCRNFEECTLHPGHEKFMALDKFLEKKPSDIGLADEDMPRIWNSIQRTVRVVVNYTSHDRPEGLRIGSKIIRCGTGYLLGRYELDIKEPCPCHQCEPLAPNRESYHFIVKSATRLIFDKQEAKNAVFECFYDSEDRKGVKMLHGVTVLGSDLNRLEADRCLILCVTHDGDLAKTLGLLCDSIEPVAYLVSHPHGESKRISVGDRLLCRFVIIPNRISVKLKKGTKICFPGYHDGVVVSQNFNSLLEKPDDKSNNFVLRSDVTLKRTEGIVIEAGHEFWGLLANKDHEMWFRFPLDTQLITDDGINRDLFEGGEILKMEMFGSIKSFFDNDAINNLEIHYFYEYFLASCEGSSGAHVQPNKSESLLLSELECVQIDDEVFHKIYSVHPCSVEQLLGDVSTTVTEHKPIFDGNCQAKPTSVSEHCPLREEHKKFMDICQFEQKSCTDIGLKVEDMPRVRNSIERSIRVVVKYTSTDRPHTFVKSETLYPFTNIKGIECERFGTGYLLGRYKFYKNEPCPCILCLVKPSLQQNRVSYHFIVKTATHVVFDIKEAQSAIFEFFNDDEDAKDVKKLHGVDVLCSHLNRLETDRCLVLCVTHDCSLAKKLDLLCDRMEESQKAILVSHPHGLSKRISVGDNLPCRFVLIPNKNSVKLKKGKKVRLPGYHDATCIPQNFNSLLEKPDDQSNHFVLRCDVTLKRTEGIVIEAGLEFWGLLANKDHEMWFRFPSDTQLITDDGTISNRFQDGEWLQMTVEIFGSIKSFFDHDDMKNLKIHHLSEYDLLTCPGSVGAHVSHSKSERLLLSEMEVVHWGQTGDCKRSTPVRVYSPEQFVGDEQTLTETPGSTGERTNTGMDHRNDVQTIKQMLMQFRNADEFKKKSRSEIKQDNETPMCKASEPSAPHQQHLECIESVDRPPDNLDDVLPTQRIENRDDIPKDKKESPRSAVSIEDNPSLMDPNVCHVIDDEFKIADDDDDDTYSKKQNSSDLVPGRSESLYSVGAVGGMEIMDSNEKYKKGVAGAEGGKLMDGRNKSIRGEAVDGADLGTKGAGRVAKSGSRFVSGKVLRDMLRKTKKNREATGSAAKKLPSAPISSNDNVGEREADRSDFVEKASYKGLWGTFQSDCFNGMGQGPAGRMINDCEFSSRHSEFKTVSTIKKNRAEMFKYYKKDRPRLWKVINRTVRVVASFTSRDRPDTYYRDSSKPYPCNKKAMEDKPIRAIRYGTGFLHGSCDWVATKPCPCLECQTSKVSKENSYFFIVRTATHVIFNEEEAQETRFDLFYDYDHYEEDRRKVKMLYGVAVLKSRLERLETDRCFVICITHDGNLAKILCRMCENFRYTKRWFLVSHPHGRGKRITEDIESSFNPCEVFILLLEKRSIRLNKDTMIRLENRYDDDDDPCIEEIKRLVEDDTPILQSTQNGHPHTYELLCDVTIEDPRGIEMATGIDFWDLYDDNEKQLWFGLSLGTQLVTDQGKCYTFSHKNNRECGVMKVLGNIKSFLHRNDKDSIKIYLRSEYIMASCPGSSGAHVDHLHNVHCSVSDLHTGLSTLHCLYEPSHSSEDHQPIEGNDLRWPDDVVYSVKDLIDTLFP